jgi:hypothetical protein
MAPKVQMQVGQIGSLNDGEYIFGSPRITEVSKTLYGKAMQGFPATVVSKIKAENSWELVFGSPPELNRHLQETFDAEKASVQKAYLRHPDQWMDVNIAVAARAHALASSDIHTLVVASGNVIPGDVLCREGLMAVAIHRPTTRTIMRLAQKLKERKLNFKTIFVATAPALGGMSLQSPLAHWKTHLGSMGPVKLLGQVPKAFPNDPAYYGRIRGISSMLSKHATSNKTMGLSIKEYLNIVEQVSQSWPGEENP